MIDGDLEAALHDRFGSVRVPGTTEWFAVSWEEVAAVAAQIKETSA